MGKHALVALAVCLALFAGAAHAGTEHGSAPKEDKGALVCPVMKASIGSAAEATGKSVFKGKTYYFCCQGCKPAFDKDPYRFICPVTGEVLPKKPAAKSTYKEKTYQFCCAGCKQKFDKDPAKYLAQK